MVETVSKRILLADDSATMRQLLRLIILRYLPCEIVEAVDGQDALEKLRPGGFNLVVTDVNMPRLDGLGLVRAVRQELHSKVPIVIVTTKGAVADRDRGMELGANAYLTKPISGVQVVRTVASLMD